MISSKFYKQQTLIVEKKLVNNVVSYKKQLKTHKEIINNKVMKTTESDK